MKKISTVQTFKSEIFKDQKLTIGVDLGDRWSFYCVLDEAGKIIASHLARDHLRFCPSRAKSEPRFGAKGQCSRKAKPRSQVAFSIGPQYV